MWKYIQKKKKINSYAKLSRENLLIDNTVENHLVYTEVDAEANKLKS